MTTNPDDLAAAQVAMNYMLSLLKERTRIISKYEATLKKMYKERDSLILSIDILERPKEVESDNDE